MNEWIQGFKRVIKGGRERERGRKGPVKVIVVSSSRGYICFWPVIWGIDKIPIVVINKSILHSKGGMKTCRNSKILSIIKHLFQFWRISG